MVWDSPEYYFVTDSTDTDYHDSDMPNDRVELSDSSTLKLTRVGTYL